MSRQPTGEDAPSGRARPATSADVARAAGVSRATVSHVLNNQVERFSAETVERVRDAALSLGYVRSAAGRALVMGRSDFVVLVLPYTTFTNVQDVIEVLSSEVEKIGLSPVVHFSVPRAQTATSRRLQHMVETLRPAGVVDLGGLSPHDIAFLDEVGCMLVNGEGQGQQQPDYNTAIGDFQARHLRARGYPTLAYGFLSDARDDPYGQMRADAVAAYCAQERLAPPLYLRVPLEQEGARKVLEEALPRTGVPLAVACYNDLVALALADAAKSLGLDVPRDLAVIGVEYAPFGQVITPRLTTIAADVPVSLSHIIQALDEGFGGFRASEIRVGTAEEAFRIVQGETT
ncbi:DNA-binding LacI/PurR family transcriptional regulator [Actinocorallia herbida]|uniref:DNA-binding LacI/PurR family transcriptional regulator n=1 Tax=Actinocorallia herbida TaxID=58109 RepID=A0A3N1CZ84_9ACTN|nr:LacI family DNA-binding transcriptional regulator [Actinocorallia herbida]ROO86577.1 DNA-binding LacI/PurR family transcriptional regulator [Actinocorallia herbida]